MFQLENWPQNWRFCIFDLHFAQILALFSASRAPTTHLCLRKYIFGIVLFAQPFFPCIYGVTVFQMENWPQNWWFCIFDLHLAYRGFWANLTKALPPIFRICPNFCEGHPFYISLESYEGSKSMEKPSFGKSGHGSLGIDPTKNSNNSIPLKKE